jgi:hypothetical protein
VAENLIPHRLGQQRVELAKVAEHDVAAEIPGESSRVNHRAGQASGMVGSLQQEPIPASQSLELSRAGQPAGAGTDDHDPSRLHRLTKR